MKYIFSIFLGIISVFSFSPYNIKPLIVFGFSGLLAIIIKQEKIKDVIIISLLFSVSFYTLGTWWLFTIEDKLSSILIVSFGTIALMSTYLIFSSIIIYVIANKSYIKFLFTAPVVLTFFEYLRGTLFTGFTWLSPAHAFLDIGINALYPIFGFAGINFIFYTLISILSLLFITKRFKEFYLLLTFISVVYIASYISKNINWTKKEKSNIKSLIVQTNISIHDKTSDYEILKNFRKIINAINSKENIKYAFLPESIISRDYNDLKEDLKKELKKLNHNVIIFFGGYKKGFNGSYNVIFDKNLTTLYIKNHLIPFGEYTPKWLKVISPNLPMNNIDTKVYKKIFKINNITFAPSICYELLFPNELRESANKANVLLHISELGWFSNSWAAKYLENLARITALMFQKSLIYSVNSGYSAYIDKDGTILNKAPKKGFYLIEFNLTLYKGNSLYSKYGYLSIVILFGIWSLLIILFYKGKR